MSVMLNGKIICRFSKNETRRQKSNDRTNRLVVAFFLCFVMTDLFYGRTDTGKPGARGNLKKLQTTDFDKTRYRKPYEVEVPVKVRLKYFDFRFEVLFSRKTTKRTIFG